MLERADTTEAIGLNRRASALLDHALVRADNTEPVSGKPTSAIYYDVDLDVSDDVASK